MFSNKVVLITGGAAGIGTATSVAFAKQGASIAVVEKDSKKRKNLEQICDKMGIKMLTIDGDITIDRDIKTIIQKTIDKYGRLDVLVNNTGIFEDKSSVNNESLNTDAIKRQIRGVMNITRFSIPYLRQTRGNVVNVPGASGVQNKTNINVYITFKSTLEYFTKASERMLSSCGITISVIDPGVIIEEAYKPGYSSLNLVFGALVDAEEVANYIVHKTSVENYHPRYGK